MGKTRSRSAVLAAAAALVLGVAGPAAAAEVSDPIIDGLASPLGLAVGRDGTIYVAQSFGGTVSEFRNGTLQTTAAAEFPTGVDAIGRGNVTFLAGGSVHVVNPSGKVRTLASLAEYETNANPDAGNAYGLQNLGDECRTTIESTFAEAIENAQTPEQEEELRMVLGAVLPHGGVADSNPYAVAIMPTGNRIVADAAGNTLLRVTPWGKVSTVAVLPPRPAVVSAEAAAENGLPGCVVGLTLNFDFVPTDVELGPDGLFYVTSLPGGPEGPSALGARGGVFTVNPFTGKVRQIADGFNGATDLAVTPRGEVFVTELFGGRVSKVVSGGPQPVAEMTEPVAIEYARGKLYVARGVFSGPGQVVTITR